MHVGVDSFVSAVGEQHRREHFDSAPVVLLAAAAARTRSNPATGAKPNHMQ